MNAYSFLAFLALCVEYFRHRRRKRREKRDGPVPLVPVPPAALGDPEITGAAALRADRRACIAGGLAWTPLGALLGAFLTGWGIVSWPVAVAVVALQVAGAWVFGAVMGRSYPLLKFAEFALRAGWWRGGFMRRLEDAADRGLLRRDGTGYVFADDAVRGRLAAGYTAAVQSTARRQAQRQSQRRHCPAGPAARSLTSWRRQNQADQLGFRAGRRPWPGGPYYDRAAVRGRPRLLDRRARRLRGGRRAGRFLRRPHHAPGAGPSGRGRAPELAPLSPVLAGLPARRGIPRRGRRWSPSSPGPGRRSPCCWPTRCPPCW